MQHRSCGSLILCLFLTHRSVVEGASCTRTVFVYRGQRWRHKQGLNLHIFVVSLPNCERNKQVKRSTTDLWVLFTVSCIMSLRGRQQSHIIAFHKCQENLQYWAPVTKYLQRSGSAGTQQEGYMFSSDCCFLPDLTFRSDDDDFNASDEIMSRIFGSCRLWRSGIQGSCFSIHSVSKKISLPRACITHTRDTNT